MGGAAVHTIPCNNQRSLHASEARWFAVRTPYKREKTALRELLSHGLEAYVPLVKRVKQHSKKIKAYELPLINNYCFVRIRRPDVNRVLSVRDVADFVRFSGEIIAIPDDEIALLRRIVGESNDIALAGMPMKMGSRVEIIGGRLTGIKGRIIEEKSKHLLLVEMETLGWTIQLEVSPNHIRPI